LMSDAHNTGPDPTPVANTIRGSFGNLVFIGVQLPNFSGQLIPAAYAELTAITGSPQQVLSSADLSQLNQLANPIQKMLNYC